MKVLVYPQFNNQIAMVIPADASALEKFPEKFIPSNETMYAVIDDSQINHAFFDAYEFDPAVGAKVDTSKAKTIWLNHYRTARTPILQKLDVEFMRAVEAGDTNLQKEIAAKKQALRDVTKTDLPDTLEGIKATWPEVLGENPFAS